LTEDVAQLNVRMTNIENMVNEMLMLVKGTTFSNSVAVPTCAYTFAEWLLHWQEKYKRPKQSGEVYKWNLKRITDNIIPILGDIPLTELTTDHMQDFINDIPPSNARDKLTHIFSGSLRKALDLGHLVRNPFKAVELEKNTSVSYPVLQPHTQLKILWAINNPKYLRMFMFYCCTGFRLSEGLSINPKNDIDYFFHKIILTMPDKKNKKHKRIVPYLPSLLNDFDLTSDTLFPDVTADGARQYFYKLFKKHDIDACFHSFRHTFISCCYHVGIPIKYIQKWVGHTSVVMTMDTYTHILTAENTPILDYITKLKSVLKL